MYLIGTHLLNGCSGSSGGRKPDLHLHWEELCSPRLSHLPTHLLKMCKEQLPTKTEAKEGAGYLSLFLVHC